MLDHFPGMLDDPQEHLRSMFMHKRLDVVSLHVVVSSFNSRRHDAGNVIHMTTGQAQSLMFK